MKHALLWKVGLARETCHEPSGRGLNLALAEIPRARHVHEFRKQPLLSLLNGPSIKQSKSINLYSRLTLVDDGLLLAEVGECREGLDSVLLCESLVVDFDEVDAKVVGVIVDFL
jgi:hypothetical protein